MKKSTFWSMAVVFFVSGVFSGIVLEKRSSSSKIPFLSPHSWTEDTQSETESSQKCLKKCFSTMMGCEVSAGSNMLGGGLGCATDFSACQKSCNPYGSGTMIS